MPAGFRIEPVVKRAALPAITGIVIPGLARTAVIHDRMSLVFRTIVPAHGTSIPITPETTTTSTTSPRRIALPVVTLILFVTAR
jgi:hypothetical protein